MTFHNHLPFDLIYPVCRNAMNFEWWILMIFEDDETVSKYMSVCYWHFTIIYLFWFVLNFFRIIFHNLFRNDLDAYIFIFFNLLK